MGERGHRAEEREEAIRQAGMLGAHEEGKSDPAPGRPAADLAEAVKRLDEDMARQARLYGDAAQLQEALGGPMGQVLEEVKGLEARRNALAEEIGHLEARKIALAAEVQQAETAAKG
jgi:hypothetical protein